MSGYRPYITKAQARRRRRLLGLVVALTIALLAGAYLNQVWTESDKLQGQYPSTEVAP